MVRRFDIAFCVVLEYPNESRIYKAVSHRHAVAIYLKLLDDYEKYAHKEIEVYEWLKPFNSRKNVLVDDGLLWAITHEHGTAKAKLQASISRLY